MLHPKSNEGMADLAYRRLLGLISQGKIREADLVSHRELAVRLGMSKMPVGMALKRLEREGFVESVEWVGTRVCRIDAEAMWGMLQWRIALECQVVRLACEWIDDAGANRLLEAADTLERLIKESEFESHKADAEFHLLLGDLCGCHRLREELDRLNIYHIKLAVCEAVSAARKEPPELPPDHVEVARAVISRDPVQAERAMRHHLERSRGLYGFTEWYRANKK